MISIGSCAVDLWQPQRPPAPFLDLGFSIWVMGLDAFGMLPSSPSRQPSPPL